MNYDEVKTPPIRMFDAEGGEYVTFGPQHTLADIARWIAENPVDAEEILRLVKESQP